MTYDAEERGKEDTGDVLGAVSVACRILLPNIVLLDLRTMYVKRQRAGTAVAIEIDVGTTLVSSP